MWHFRGSLPVREVDSSRWVKCIGETVRDNNSLSFPKYTLNKDVSQDYLKLSIYSLTGKLILKRNLRTGSNRIDISSFYQGIYAIEVSGGDWTVLRKVIKE
jgi:hypothetical protein